MENVSFCYVLKYYIDEEKLMSYEQVAEKMGGTSLLRSRCPWINAFEAISPKLLALRDVWWIGTGRGFVVWTLSLVPTDEDDMHFHLSIEEYLHSLISLINELVSIQNLSPNLPHPSLVRP